MKYRIDFILNNKQHWPIEIESNADYRDNIWTEDCLDKMLSSFIRSNFEFGEYQDGEIIFARDIKLSFIEKEKVHHFYSCKRDLQIFPRLDDK